MGDRRAHRCAFAPVLLADEDHVGPAAPPRFDELTSAVRRAVVHDDDLFLELEPGDAVE